MKLDELFIGTGRNSSIECQLNDIAIMCYFTDKSIDDDDIFVITNGHKKHLSNKINSKIEPNQA